MSPLQYFADALMSVTWVGVYSLVLVSTLKEKWPAMAPLACVFVFPWEFAAAYGTVGGATGFSCLLFAHVGFALLDASIIYVFLFRLRIYSKRNTALYLLLLLLVVAVTYYVFEINEGILYSSFILTIISMVLWLDYVRRPGYPVTKLNYIIAVLKFLADLLTLFAYHNYNTPILVLSILLSLVHLLHLLVLSKKYLAAKKQPGNNPMVGMTAPQAVAVEESCK